MIEVHKRRLRTVHKLLKQEALTSALVISSSTPKNKTRDIYYPFQQNQDFFYLSGSKSQDLVLIINAKDSKPTLFAPPTDKHKILWEGPQENYAQLADTLGAEIIITKTPDVEIKKRLVGVEKLFFQNEAGRAWDITQSFLKAPSHARSSLPQVFTHSDVILTPLRLHKEPYEISRIKKASEVTNGALYDVLPMIASGVSESFVAAAIDFFFKVRECFPAFETNVSFGKSGATLHHEPSSKTLRAGELILIDCGASYQGYAADITRTISIDGTFTPIQEDLYLSVLEAQRAAISKIRAGVKIKSVYDAAAKALTLGLMETKVLRGKLSKLLEKKAYLPYFPHGIGHSLGLDVHDVGNIRANNGATLEKGMVITIEPGLYFQRAVGKVPAMGIRIEDDVLVTDKGSEILSEGFPKKIKELKKLMADFSPE